MRFCRKTLAVMDKMEELSKSLLKKKSAFATGLKASFMGKTWRGIMRHKFLYLLLLPAFALIAVFSYAPMFGLAIAFLDFNLVEGVGGSEFIGLKMFYRILFSPEHASYLPFRNTIYISLIRIATNFPVILVFTLLVHEVKSRRFKSTVQAISYIPFFISWIAIGGMSYNLFGVNDGILNKVLGVFGKAPITWYSEPQYWWGILTISSLWKGMGWATLIYMSSLGAIDSELYDACRIDGGGRFRQMVTVTLPGIMNVIMLQIILDVGGIMSDNYDQILAMINGSQSLDSVTRVVGTLEFEALIQGSQYSKATAYGLVRGIIGLTLVLMANKIAKKSDNEGIL